MEGAFGFLSPGKAVDRLYSAVLAHRSVWEKNFPPPGGSGLAVTPCLGRPLSLPRPEARGRGWRRFSGYVVSDSHDPMDYSLPGSCGHAILLAGRFVTD